MRRGEIYYIRKSFAEENAGRPGIIVSNNVTNVTDPIVEVVYLTTNPKTKRSTHVLISSTGRPAVALCEQIYTVAKNKIGDRFGECTEREMQQIDFALMAGLGIPRKEKEEQTKDPEREQEEDSLPIRGGEPMRSQADEMTEEERDEPEEKRSAAGDMLGFEEGFHKPLMLRVPDETDEPIEKIRAERRIYKELYERLLEKIIKGGILPA